jgi:DNA-directed RNA polymerase subunit RPC12/RpoP
MSEHADAYPVWIWDCPHCGEQNESSSQPGDDEECESCGEWVSISIRDGNW